MLKCGPSAPLSSGLSGHRLLKETLPSLEPLSFSVEFFPPKTPAMEVALWEALSRVAPFEPQFVSVTYGAGGSTRARTHETVRRILSETSLKPAAHLTCVGASKGEIEDILQEYARLSVPRLVALRGDPLTGIGTPYLPHPGGYASSFDLVAAIKKFGGFDVAVSAYPERHPESPDWETELTYLKRKADAGADCAITQYFFDNDLYEAYLERVQRAGITLPIIPGILPIHHFPQVARFSEKCGTQIPSWLCQRFESLSPDTSLHQNVACALALQQVLDLIARGVRNFHFYSMNRADLVSALLHMLPTQQEQSSRA